MVQHYAKQTRLRDLGIEGIDLLDAGLNECGFLISDCGIRILDMRPKV
jgi:hypothetical protein